MRLVTFLSNGQPRPGLVVEDAVLDLGTEFTSLQAIIEGGREALQRIEAMARSRQATIPLVEENLLAPLPEPRRNIFCVGWNYLAHFEEGKGRRGLADDAQLPDHPTFFTKASTAANGPYAPIVVEPHWTRRLDYEGELAVVIGRKGRDVPEEEALNYVFGYMAGNDISARDLQRRHGGQWLKGKSLDGSCPMGPWLVTADEIPDPQQLEVRCWVNDELRQEAGTRPMIFTVARMIGELSHGMTLLPGDIILKATPEGVGFAQNPPAYLHPGDVVTVEISGIGRIRNRIESAR